MVSEKNRTFQVFSVMSNSTPVISAQIFVTSDLNAFFSSELNVINNDGDLAAVTYVTHNNCGLVLTLPFSPSGQGLIWSTGPPSKTCATEVEV